jgi:hypothetical protein
MLCNQSRFHASVSTEEEWVVGWSWELGFVSRRKGEWHESSPRH